ncbi:glycosyltransferase family 2 protein [Erythrobacter sp. HA6-11]
MSGNIAVIIPAYRAAWCIADAVASALAQPEVAEVLVVDDASGDETLDAAATADDGTGRLKLLRQEVNQGPSAARNRAIAESGSPYIAVLDSDDRFLPGRFATLLSIEEDWDFVADDILFAGNAETIAAMPAPERQGPPRTRKIDLAEFARRNISKRGADRSELGFLKPLMRREFLEKNNLVYNEQLRLGEDFILYAEALEKGAKFLLAEACGYGAIERSGSLSGNHSSDDLAALTTASREIMSGLPRGLAKDLMQQHAAALDAKVAHRRFLDRKRSEGLLPATARLARSPNQLFSVASNIAKDKLSPAAPSPLPRQLFSSEEFDRP